MIFEYCPVCKQDTIHHLVEDKIFDTGLECDKCHTIWEAEITIEKDSEPQQLSFDFTKDVNE